MYATQMKAKAIPEGQHGVADVPPVRGRVSKPNPLGRSLALRPSGVQATLVVSQPADPGEQEADEVADRVMRSATSRPGHRISAGASPSPECGDCQEEPVPHDSGRLLDPAARDFFETRFGQGFSDVRVHTGAQAEDAARQMSARAFTHGHDVVFGAGQYAPRTDWGRQLLAHELTHVVQQRSVPRSQAAPLARQTWGTSKTTAPPAKNESPGDVFRGTLKGEVALFHNAGIILDWISSQRVVAGGATVTSFTTSFLFADVATMKKMKPVPTSDIDLVPALEMLEYYEVVTSRGPGEWDIVLAPLQPGQAQQDVNRAKFDQSRSDITGFQKSFEKRFDAKGHSVKQIAQQELLEDSLAGGSADEKKRQRDAETNVAAVGAELGEFVAFRKKGPPIFRVTSDSLATATVQGKTNVLLPVAGQKKPTPVEQANFDHIEAIQTGTSPEVEKRRGDIQKRQKRADEALFRAQGFHRFAVEMVWFLHELAAASSIKFAAGTYPSHGKFGEYAADMFPVIGENSAGFYGVAKAEQLVDDINKVAETGHPIWGKFAWQIVYNDVTLQTKINAKYGARMSSAPHHGPAPDKLHMHLDIRPLNLVPDPATGYDINRSGRVTLY